MKVLSFYIIGKSVDVNGNRVYQDRMILKQINWTLVSNSS